jgi:hypothetical protein
MQEIFSKEETFDIKADESRKIISIEPRTDPVYFLKLMLLDSEGNEMSSNFYWLSGKGDEEADFTALNRLPEVELTCTPSSIQKENGKNTLTVEIENPSPSLAFFVNPKIIKKDSKDLVLPVFWEDNYFSLLPNEKKEVKVTFLEKDLNGESPVLAIDGWNIKYTEVEPE